MSILDIFLLSIIFLVGAGAIWWWYEGKQENRIEVLEDEVFRVKEKKKKKA